LGGFRSRKPSRSREKGTGRKGGLDLRCLHKRNKKAGLGKKEFAGGTDFVKEKKQSISQKAQGRRKRNQFVTAPPLLQAKPKGRGDV